MSPAPRGQGSCRGCPTPQTPCTARAPAQIQTVNCLQTTTISKRRASSSWRDFHGRRRSESDQTCWTLSRRRCWWLAARSGHQSRCCFSSAPRSVSPVRRGHAQRSYVSCCFKSTRLMHLSTSTLLYACRLSESPAEAAVAPFLKANLGCPVREKKRRKWLRKGREMRSQQNNECGGGVLLPLLNFSRCLIECLDTCMKY